MWERRSQHYTLAHDHFNQLGTNEGKIVPAQFCLMKQNRHYLNALCHIGPSHGQLAPSVKSWPHNCETGVRSPSPVVPLSKEPSTQLTGPILLPPAVAQKLRLLFVQLRAVSRCCIVFACQRLTMLHLLWFMCSDCPRLSAINKACNSEGNLHTQEEEGPCHAHKQKF